MPGALLCPLLLCPAPWCLLLGGLLLGGLLLCPALCSLLCPAPFIYAWDGHAGAARACWLVMAECRICRICQARGVAPVASVAGNRWEVRRGLYGFPGFRICLFGRLSVTLVGALYGAFIRFSPGRAMWPRAFLLPILREWWWRDAWSCS